ncbi:MAG TPA: transporter [Candidatus Binatia bacterium]|nr:transporter [Candidatus Binatia bacterium]
MPRRFNERNFLGWVIGALALALVTVSVETHAQDLEPRAYANTPVGLNFLIAGYAYSKGAVGTDPAVPIEDAQVRISSGVLAYVRTLDLWGRSGKVDIILPYSWASGRARLLRQEHTREVSGLGDPKLRFSVLLYGGPALTFEEFKDYTPDIIIGTSLEVTPPLGQYDSDKLLNIGTNRWSIKPELGISKTWGPLILELASGVRFYTDNNNFLDGKTLQLSPVYSVQGHLIYSFTTGIWAGFDALYYTERAGPSTGEKAKASKMHVSALHSLCRLIGTTRSNSTAPPMCTRRLERIRT